MSLYPPPELRAAEVWTHIPESFRKHGISSDWGAANRPGQAVHSFLEGPSFDHNHNLYVTDIPFGRVFRISPTGVWTLVTEYDGWPNGLKIHRDGRIFITDYKRGIVQLDANSGAITPVLAHRKSEAFKGVNDLVFDRNGLMYFTDQGQTGLHDPTGRVYRYDLETCRLDCLLANCPSPNGLALSPDETMLFVAMTRGNAVWRLPLFPDGSVSKVGTFTAMAGGVGGADGMVVDAAGSLFVADAGNGCVWAFSNRAVPLYRISASGTTGGHTCTNVAFGGPDRRHLFITESDTGNILRCEMDVPGHPMFAERAA